MAARTVSRKFGAFDMTSPTSSGVALDRWDSQILHATRFEDRLKADGSICVSDRYVGHEVRLSGTVSGADTGEATANLEALQSALANGEDYLTLFSDRRLLCRLAGGFTYDVEEGALMKVYRWSATMRSRWPHWESTSLSTDTTSVSGAGPDDIALAVNSAEAPTYPRISIENTGTAFSNKTLTLAHIATGAHITMAGLSMSAGQTLVLDLLEGALGNGVSIPVTPYTLEANWFYLIPGAATTIELSHTIGGSASLDVIVTWRDAYWTL